MGAAGIAAIIIGYAFAYSGISNLMSGGKGWGLFHTMTGRGDNTSGASAASFVNQIHPLGDTGSSTPEQGTSPVSGTVQA